MNLGLELKGEYSLLGTLHVTSPRVPTSLLGRPCPPRGPTGKPEIASRRIAKPRERRIIRTPSSKLWEAHSRCGTEAAGRIWLRAPMDAD